MRHEWVTADPSHSKDDLECTPKEGWPNTTDKNELRETHKIRTIANLESRATTTTATTLKITTTTTTTKSLVFEVLKVSYDYDFLFGPEQRNVHKAE